MKKLFGILMVMTIFVTSIAFAPAQVDLVVLIHNDTESAIVIKIIGDDKTYSFTAAPGWREKVVEAGTYEVKYEACGVGIAYTLVVDDGTEVINIEPCPKNIDTSKFVIESHFDVPVDVDFSNFDELYGSDYTFTTEEGRNRFKEIDSGWYFYSYDACDTTFTGQFRILKNGSSRLVLRSCERAILYEAGVHPIDSKLIIRSKFAPSFGMTLIGPVSKFVQVNTGGTRVDLPAGTYTYFYAVNGRRFSGFIVVNDSGTAMFNVGYFDYVTIPSE